MKCTCYVKESEEGVEPQLIQCPLCKAAPKLAETLKEARIMLSVLQLHGAALLQEIEQVLAEARGE